MSGEVTGGYVFIYASYGIAAASLIGLAIWTMTRLITAKKKLSMLDQTEKTGS